MNDLKKDLAKVANESNLIVLLGRSVRNYANEPAKQLQCFSLMVNNAYATPKFFEALTRHLDNILTANTSLIGSVLDLLRDMLQTKRVNIENCNFIADVLNGHKSKLPPFGVASVNVFMKGLDSYKKALEDMDHALEQQKPGPVMPNDGVSTKYAVNRPNNIERVTKYGVGGPRRNVSTKYAVFRPVQGKDDR